MTRLKGSNWGPKNDKEKTSEEYSVRIPFEPEAGLLQESAQDENPNLSILKMPARASTQGAVQESIPFSSSSTENSHDGDRGRGRGHGRGREAFRTRRNNSDGRTKHLPRELAQTVKVDTAAETDAFNIPSLSGMSKETFSTLILSVQGKQISKAEWQTLVEDANVAGAVANLDIDDQKDEE